MMLVERFGLFAPLALIGASWLPLAEHEGLGRVLDERVAAQGFLVDLDAQAGAARQLEPAVAGLDGAGEERGLLVARRELDRERAAERRGHVEGGRPPGAEVERGPGRPSVWCPGARGQPPTAPRGRRPRRSGGA